MPPETQDHSIWSVPQLFAAAYRYKGRAILTFAAVMLAAILALVLLPKEYASQAKLFVRVGRENVALDPTITKQEVIGLTTTRDIEMNSILEHLRSRSLAEQVLDKVEPNAKAMTSLERDQAVRGLEKRIFVDAPKASAVVVLHCESKDPVEAQSTLATYIDAFLSEHMRVNHSSGSHQFFEEQSELLSKQIEVARAKLRDAKTQAGMASLEGQRTALETQISSAESAIARVEASLAANKAKVAALESAINRVPESLLGQLIVGTPNDGMAAMRQTLFDLRAKEQELLSKVTPDHPSAIAIREQVKGVERALSDATPDRAEMEEAVLVRETAEAKSLSAELQTIQSQLTPLRERLKKLNDIEGTIETLVSDLKRQEVRYQVYIEHLEEARMDEALHADRITNVSIIQPATFTPTPIRPRKAAVLVMALVTAVLCGVGVVMLSEMCAPKVSSIAEPLTVRRTSTTYVPESAVSRLPR